jgi:hypothetical protein
MKSTLEKVVQSIRFWANVRHRKKQINPEIREMLEDFHKKKRVQVSKGLEEEEKQIDSLKSSYDYKCFEHFRKIGFLKTKEKAENFIQYCDFNIFSDKSKWTRGLFFFRYFNTPKDYIITKLRKLIIFLLGLFAFKIGLINGFKDSQLYDEIKENITDIRTEDQLLDLLHKRGLPILVLYYYSGDYNGFLMQNAQGRFVEKYGENYVTMAKVNCKYNLDLCLKKVQYLVIPQWELMYPPFTEVNDKGEDISKYPVVPCKFNRSIEGIEGFLMEQGIIPDKYNPMLMINQSMRKYI